MLPIALAKHDAGIRLLIAAVALFTFAAPRVEAGAPRRGIIIADVDAKSGVVTSCRMLKSTGDPIADRKVIDSVRKWRFKPNTVSKVRGPVTVTKEGVRFDDAR
jgi:TonB family protein